MTVKEIFSTYEKKELMYMASIFGIDTKGETEALDEVSEKLLDDLSAFLLEKDHLQQNFYMFNDKEIDIIKRASSGPVDLESSRTDLRAALKVEQMSYGFIVYYGEKAKFTVPDEVQKVYREIDSDVFDAKRKKLSWLYECLGFCEQFYGITPVDELQKVYNSRPKFQASMQDIMDMYAELPSYRMSSILSSPIEGDESPVNIFVSNIFMDDRNLHVLMQTQKECDFKEFSYDQVKDYLDNGYLSGTLEYKELLKFFQRDLDLDFTDADKLSQFIWKEFATGAPFEPLFDEIIRRLESPSIDSAGKGAVIVTEPDKDELKSLMYKASGHTNSILYRGNMPIDINKKN
ncbi:MAG: hypothetical protein VZR00_05105 [Lachnospiraceae bacterium]|jgi:hypothetical protein|nr:hypothetical protein [Lachnospiraceae bacterium]MEE3461255.1 hypothetical protein [Lachnospiraceae bacterium]